MTSNSLEPLLPLTIAQRGLWMAQFLAPPGSNFNIAEAIDLPGKINEDLFLQSLHTVYLETDTLRCRIIETVDGPRHYAAEPYDARATVMDFSHLPDAAAHATAWMQARVLAPVSLSRDQLWKNTLIRLADDHYIWFHCCHHAVLDGFSGGMIGARVAVVYSALLAGEAPPPTPFLPLATLLEQETAYRNSSRYQADRAHWLEALQDVPEPFSLSLHAHKAPSGQHGGAITRAALLPQDHVDALAALGRAHDITLPQTLTAFLVAYLFRVSGEGDLVIGMPVSARANRALRQTPGMVANVVTMRFAVTAETTAIDLMIQARRAMRSALRHQQFRYEDLRKELGFFEKNRQIARIGINIEPFDYRLSFGGIPARNSNIANGAMEDLTIFVFNRQDGTGLSLQCDANPALYSTAELEAHLSRITRMVDAMAKDPTRAVSAIPMITPDDSATHHSRSLAAKRTWPQTSPHTSIADLLTTALQATPTATAVIDRMGSLSHAEILQRSTALATVLAQAGIGPGRLVGIALPRDHRMIVALAAIAMTGAAWLPIDISGPPARTALMLEDAHPALVIVPDQERILWAFGRTALILPAQAGAPTTLPPGNAAPPPQTPPPQTPAPQTLAPHTAYVTYTSGTTGRPKGVIVPHKALTNLLLSMKELLDFGPRERLLAVTTLTFDIAALELLLPLISGGAVVIATYEDVRNPRHLAALIRANGVTAMQATPTLWQAMLSAAESEVLRGLKLLTGGEPLPAHLARRLFDLGRDVINLYGPTETTIWSTAHRLTGADLDPPPVGRPIANTEVFIVDRNGALLPDGIVGELVIGGEGVATGYLNRPELTNERFITIPYGTAGIRAYRTGDRAAWDAKGQIRLFGRMDDQVKIKGMRIEPGEIETALLNLDGIEQAALLVTPDTTTGAPTLVACIVTSAAGPDAADIRRLLSGTLPPQMIPTHLHTVSALPRTSSGKLDRAALRLLATPAPPAPATQYARTPAERMLADLWAPLLGLDEVDITANFFDLGGDSLKAMQMISALAEQGYDLPVGHLFTEPTIAALAPLFADEAPQNDPLAVLLPLRTDGPKPPIFCIHPVIGLGWSFHTLAALLPAEHPIYALQNARLLLEDTPPTSLDTVIDRYVQDIRETQRTGPYHLIGWSMGGVIAHGIATRLREEGEDIALLALLDAYPYRQAATPIRSHSPLAVQAALNFLHLTPDDDAPLPATLDDVADLLLETLDLSTLPATQGSQNSSLTNLIETARRVTLQNLALLQAYRPGMVDTDILFIRAGLRGGPTADALIADSADIWEDHTRGTVTIHTMPCRHQDMLQPGDPAGTVARHITAALSGSPLAQGPASPLSPGLSFLHDQPPPLTDRQN